MAKNEWYREEIDMVSTPPREREQEKRRPWVMKTRSEPLLNIVDMTAVRAPDAVARDFDDDDEARRDSVMVTC